MHAIFAVKVVSSPSYTSTLNWVLSGSNGIPQTGSITVTKTTSNSKYSHSLFNIVIFIATFTEK